MNVPVSPVTGKPMRVVYEPATEADMSAFTQQKLAVIDTVCAKMKSLSAHDISILSHSEPAWQNHLHQSETIPFAEAFTLKAV